MRVMFCVALSRIVCECVSMIARKERLATVWLNLVFLALFRKPFVFSFELGAFSFCLSEARNFIGAL